MRLARADRAEPPGAGEAEQVHEAVPVDADREMLAEQRELGQRDRDRVEVRVDEHGRRILPIQTTRQTKALR